MRDIADLFRQHGPPLIQQRRAAGREAWLNDDLEAVRCALVDHTRAAGQQEFVVDDRQEIARRETVRRIQDVGLAPTNELLSGFIVIGPRL